MSMYRITLDEYAYVAFMSESGFPWIYKLAFIRLAIS